MNLQRMSLFLLRLTTGWLFLYAGLSKVFDPTWTSVPYLQNAKTFPDFFAFFLRPDILPFTDFLNEWGLTLIGVSLILGVFVRLSSYLGVILMFLYYFPILDFPYPNIHSYIIDEHIIYAAVLFLLGSLRAGRIWGLENKCSSLPICAKFPKIRNILG